MIEFADVQAAYNRIHSIINHTPVMTSRTLNERGEANFFLKCENFQRVGAFKFRGAVNALSQLSPEQRQHGVITHSSGNHAQALALAAKQLGIHATIVMPKGSPQVKIQATRETYGAEVVLCENTVQSRQETAQKLQEQYGYTLIHPYDNDQIIAGAGTAGYELLKEIPDLDIIMTPVGGGGLLSGTAIAVKGFNPLITIYAAEPERANDAYRSFHSGWVEHNQNPDTIADGLRTDLCTRTLAIIRANVKDILVVSEEAIISAMQFIWERMKLVIEPSAAVPIAAVFTYPHLFNHHKIGIILSGGNIELAEFFASLKSKVKK